MVSRRTTDRGFGATLTTLVDAQSGNLEIDIRFEGDDAPSGSYNIRAGFNGLGQVASRFSNYVGNLRSQLGGGQNFQLAISQLPFDLPTGRSDIIPSDLQRFRDGLVRLDSFNLQPSIGPQGPPQGGGGFGFFPLQTDIPEVGGAQVNRSVSRDFNWRPIPIPDAPNLDIGTPNLPPFTLVVEVVRTERLQPRRTWRTSTTISTDILFETRSVGDALDCGTIHRNLERRIDQLASRASSPKAQIQDAQRRLDRIKDSITTADRNAPSAFRANISEVVGELGVNTVRQRAEELRGLDVRAGNLENLRREFNNLRSEIQNTGRCAGELMDQLESQVGDLDDLLNRVSQIRTERDRLENFLSNIDRSPCRVQFDSIDSQVRRLEDQAGIGPGQPRTTFDRLDRALDNLNDVRGDIRANIPQGNRCRSEFESRLQRVESNFRRRLQSPELSGLDCEDVDQGIRTIVSNFEDRAQEFTSLPREERRPQQRAELLADQGRVIRTIRNNVDDVNPCKSQLIGRVQTAISQIQGAEATPEFELECTDRFEEIGSRLDDFEDRVLNLDAPVEPQQLQEISREGNEIISMIEEETSSGTRCRDEFVERTRALISRAERLTARVRITTEDGSESQERREELLQQILGSLDRIQREREAGEEVREGIEDQLPQT